MSKRFYITTTLPYVNSDPHIGFALEIVQADVIARYHRIMGDEVVFNTGTDEHGIKIYRKALEQKKDPQAYVDEYAQKFDDLKGALNLSYTNFTRTSDPKHKSAAQEFWRRCDTNGFIYKKNYQVKYCVGCELEKTDSELDHGKCQIHPNLEIELIEEENYFFKWSAFQEPLLKLYEDRPDFVVPDFRFNEIKRFVEDGLQDFSISRLKSKMPWGVPVPGDDTQVMYGWFDALVNYISAIGWPDDMAKFETWWPVIQYCGKDNNRQQAAMWQAMLASAKLLPSKHVIINGFINSGGQKMSKSLGNVINPYDVIEQFRGVTDFPEDVLRFVLLHDMPSFEDGDLTMESIKQSYAAHLQNGLGNLVSRIMKMATMNSIQSSVISHQSSEKYQEAFELFDLHKATGLIWDEISALDKNIQEQEPFKVIKIDQEKGRSLIAETVLSLYRIAILLKPFLPRTGEEIERLIREHKMPEKPLFARLVEARV